MGNLDRTIRIILAVGLGILYYTDIVGDSIRPVLFSLSVIFLITGFTGFCPLYFPLNISTKKKS
nr:DUF2892 domain-containing protein [Marinigracilibium pacificum]